MILPPPKLVAGILAMPPRDRLVSLYAMRIVFPRLMNDPDWRAKIRATCDELRPTQAEHQAIVEASIGVAGDLRRAMHAKRDRRHGRGVG